MIGKVKKNKFRIDRIQNRNTKFTSYIYNRYFRTELTALFDDEHVKISHGRRFASYQLDFDSDSAAVAETSASDRTSLVLAAAASASAASASVVAASASAAA